MKTSEEILKSNITFNADLQSTEEIIEAMKEYAREACREQRELCAEHVWRYWEPKNNTQEESILNTPEPYLK